MRMLPMPSYQHQEAFRVMKYVADDQSEIEFVWNSRDGVTPFVITLRSGKQATHQDWSLDRLEPDYAPPEGSRVFIDAQPGMAEVDCRRYVDRIWDDEQYPASSRWATKEDAVAALLPSMFPPGSPTLVDAELYGELLLSGALVVDSPIPPEEPSEFMRRLTVPAGPDRFA